MLEIILVFALINVIIKFAEKPLLNKIAFAQDTQESIMCRRKLLALRWGVIVLSFGLYILFIIAISDFDDYNTYKHFLWTICAITIVGIQQYGFKKLLGNISTLTKTAFLSENKDFVIFLRGFIDDDYSDIADLKKTDFEKFSEYGFMSLLEHQGISACAIGMTKESDSPIGAKRIYVDDISWQKDVKDLISKSKSIYILVRNRESCIWEIKTSLKYFEKVTFIVDDISQYNFVREQIQDTMELPIISEPPMGSIVVLTYGNGKYHAVLYSNSIDGYARMLNISQKSLKKFNKTFTKKKAIKLANKKTIIYSFVGVIVSILLIIALNIYIEYDKIREENNAHVEAIIEGNLSLTPNEKLELIASMQKKFYKISATLPMQIDENITLKNVFINESCQTMEYDITGIGIEEIDFFVMRLNLVSSFTKQQIGLYRSLDIELIYRYYLGDEIFEIRFTNEDINNIYKNL